MSQISHATRIILASILGNALEFYSLTLYGTLTSIFAALYFPSSTPLTSLLASLAAFSLSFVVRPLGAIFFGHIGDRIGRKQALSLSIIIMGIPTACIAFLPTFDQIGIWAPILLIICRFVQGICAGGEFNGATIFALEHLGKSRPGLIGGAIVGSCLFGVLIASGVIFILTLDCFPGWAWRGAFLLGGCFSFVGFYLRKKIDESPVFKDLKKEKKIVQSPLKTALVSHWRSCFLVFMIAAFDGALTYTLVSFLNVYMINYLHHSLTMVTCYSFVGSLSCMIACPLFGNYADKNGSRETLVIASFLILGLSVPTFIAINAQMPLAILGAYISLGVLVGAIIGVQPLFSQDLFPPQDRYTGISFSYSLGVGLIGGLTPILLTWGVEQWNTFLVPGLYLVSFSILFLAVLLLLPARK